jgi:hypothetical protein
MVSDEAGAAAIRQSGGHAEVYLQLLPGESRILRTTTARQPSVAAYDYVEPAGPAIPLTGTWNVAFTEGTAGNTDMPGNFTTTSLGSYTSRGDVYARFAGTAVYTLTFNAPDNPAKDYYLNLGKVGDSARVSLNGHNLGTLWAPPFRVHPGAALKPGQNTLKVEVTNIAANRIADMDRRHIKWKIFKDINVQNIKPGTAGTYEPMDASKYPERPAGLLGPVTLQPLTAKHPE